MDIVEKEIPEGHITSTFLFDEFNKQLSFRKSEEAVRDYKEIKGSRRIGRHAVQEWNEKLFQELVEKYEPKKKEVVKKTKKPIIHAGLSEKEILEKAKELNRKVKVVPMGYSPSWEREKEVINAKRR